MDVEPLANSNSNNVMARTSQSLRDLELRKSHVRIAGGREGAGVRARREHHSCGIQAAAGQVGGAAAACAADMAVRRLQRGGGR